MAMAMAGARNTEMLPSEDSANESNPLVASMDEAFGHYNSMLESLGLEPIEADAFGEVASETLQRYGATNEVGADEESKLGETDNTETADVVTGEEEEAE